MSASLEPIDLSGNGIALGAMVEIPRLPDWLVHDLPADEVVRLRSVEGSIMKVLEIDKHGYLWFGMNSEDRWFCLQPGEVAVVGVA